MCGRHFYGWAKVFRPGAALADACRRTVGNCLRLAHSGNGEERSDLPGMSVAGSTAPAVLKVLTKKVSYPSWWGWLPPFSQAAGEGSDVRSKFTIG